MDETIGEPECDNGGEQEEPLISALVSFEDLENEYDVEDHVYRMKVVELKKRFKCYRKIKRDGNCFYRAFGFRFLECYQNDPEVLDKFRATSFTFQNELINLGYSEFSVGDFHEVFISTVDSVQNGMKVETVLCEQNSICDYLVVSLRLFTTAYLQKNSVFFEQFVEGHRTMKEFCSQEVEPMGTEADHLQISALTSATNIPVRIVCMDRSDGGLKIHDFPEGSTPKIILLYRPSHYDILYEQ